MSIIPPVAGPSDAGEPVRQSYSGLYLAAPRERVLEALAGLGFTGWVGPQEDRWVVAVAANPRGSVASNRRTIDAVTEESAAALDAVVLAVEVDREQRLRLLARRGAEELVRYDSDPPEEDGSQETEIVLDEFGEPMMTGFEEPDHDDMAETLLDLCETTDEVDDPEAITSPVTESADETLADILAEELGESTSESERLKAVLRRLSLPRWVVASASLPKRVPGGPDKNEFTYLGRGKQGASGRFAAAWTNRVRKKAKDPEQRR
ncbi:hypothetical protein [Ruania alba]|uniref:Uncharacterized protein n=1 Tax=Ruania alba TaxID=648782 RepID=A0A1H5DSN0_9MICO|nr:hypothetical protein [Ruania alba]SED81905.1 hypothetical protein SAMN04488554_0781 [Ruania alba]